MDATATANELLQGGASAAGVSAGEAATAKNLLNTWLVWLAQEPV
jgi:hypothetical protein